MPAWAFFHRKKAYPPGYFLKFSKPQKTFKNVEKLRNTSNLEKLLKTIYWLLDRAYWTSPTSLTPFARYNQVTIPTPASEDSAIESIFSWGIATCVPRCVYFLTMAHTEGYRRVPDNYITLRRQSCRKNALRALCSATQTCVKQSGQKDKHCAQKKRRSEVYGSAWPSC